MLDIERLAKLETIIDSVNEQVKDIKSIDNDQSKELAELKDLIIEAIETNKETKKENDVLKKEMKTLENTVKDLKRKIEFLGKLKNFVTSPLVAVVITLFVLILASNSNLLEFFKALFGI